MKLLYLTALSYVVVYREIEFLKESFSEVTVFVSIIFTNHYEEFL